MTREELESMKRDLLALDSQTEQLRVQIDNAKEDLDDQQKKQRDVGVVIRCASHLRDFARSEVVEGRECNV